MKALVIAMTTIALAAAPAMFAQKAADAPKAESPSQVQAEQSLTGCLGGAENAFTLKTASGTVQLEGDGLASHVGKTIRVTGSQSNAAGKSIFKVSGVEVVSPRCQA